MRDAGAGVLQRPDLSFVDVHAVGRQHARVEQPLFLDPRHDRHAVLAPGLLDLERRFRQVGVQRHVEFAGQLGARPEDFRGAGVGRMRCDRRDDQRVPLPARDEFARARQRVLEARGVRRRKLEHRLAHRARADPVAAVASATASSK